MEMAGDARRGLGAPTDSSDPSADDGPALASAQASPSRPQFRLFISLVPLILSPTACCLVAVALVAWFMIYDTASDAIEVVGHEGQRIFVEGARDSILAYTNAVQRIHTSSQPRWQNTTCTGTATSPTYPNVSAFDAYDDVRLALFSQVYFLRQAAAVVSVGFPCGSLLGFQRTPTEYRWVIVDNSTGFWLRRVTSSSWQAGWDTGPDSWSKPDDLVAAGLPLNMSLRVWYTDAVQAGTQSWSGVYYSLRGQLVLTAVLPVYNPDGRLKLVAQAEVDLLQLDDFLANLQLTPNTFSLVAELDGSLLASCPPGLSTAILPNQSATGATGARVAAQHAQDARIAAAAGWLVAKFGSLAGLPEADSSFIAHLNGHWHYLYTGHIVDRYGLHWVVVIGLPRSESLRGLDGTSVQAILIIMGTLLAATLLILAVTFMLRRDLRWFARRIVHMGKMDLERARRLNGTVFLSESRLILVALGETIEALSQFRAFLPRPMLDKVRHAETAAHEAAESVPADTPPLVPDSPGAAPPPSRHGGIARSAEALATVLTPDSTHMALAALCEPTAACSSSSTVLQSSRPPYSFIHSLLERRVDRLSMTLLSLELPNLHRVAVAAGPPSDVALWHEVGLRTALEAAQRWGGEFYRLSGDALVLSWGGGRAGAASGVHACGAAWQLAQALRRLDAEAPRPALYAPRLSVVAGPTLYGVMGTAATRDLYLVGPLVKQGAHLASLNGLYGTLVLVDSVVAQQCGSLFSMQMCGLIRSSAAPPQPVYELLGPASDEEGRPQCAPGEEWMYRSASPPSFQLAVDALRAGQTQQARQRLEELLLFRPGDRHARRMLDRIVAKGARLVHWEELSD